MKRDISIYLKDILGNIDKARRFTDGMSLSDFLHDEKTSYAVIRCIEIMGEAAKNIPEPVRLRYGNVPWKDMAGMRDKIAHFYFGVNLEKVWLVLTEDLPTLEKSIKKILKEFAGSS